MRVAVVGCGHGQLDRIYSAIEHQNVDLLIICGDFEACRNEFDLNCLAGPDKYHILKDYWKYYKGDEVAPVLTIFVGGNHEASNHMWELYYGGWVAHNIYFMGYSNVINVGDLRIVGISGIYNKKDYHKEFHMVKAQKGVFIM
jgi:lariat debranching enzyme